MAHELFDIHIAAYAAKAFFILGFLLIPVYSLRLVKAYGAQKNKPT